MKRTGSVLMLITLLLPVMLMSVEYNLNNYQEPDNFEHGLNFGLYNEGYVNSKEHEDRLYHSSNISADYFARKYSRQSILNISLFTDLDYEIYSVNTTDSLQYDADTPRFNSHFEIGAELRQYLYKDLFFNIDTYCYAHNSYSDRDSKSAEYNSTGNGKGYFYTESAEIGLGYGRVEDVSKACQAVEILSELEKAGLLAREVNKEDIESLADRLVQLTTLRLFDSRLVNMEKVRQINSELFEQGLLSGDNIESFVIIMDLYDLGTVFSRKSGWDIYPEFGIDNTDGYSEGYFEKVYIDTIHSDYTRDSESNNGSRTYQPGLSFNYYQVLSSKWQLEASGNYGYFWSEYDNEELEIRRSETSPDSTWEKREYDKEGYSVELNLELSWYPDTRTEFWSRLNYDISDSDYDEVFQSDDETENYTKSYSEFERVYYISAGINYYFSPKLNLLFKLSYRGDNDESFYTYNSRFKYDLRVRYYLF
ncbi:MAG: hypothetical protein RAO94_03595 [Candidatus Stygibacter australis]|nr:hypothetical protein [Candidatus Stygibacter australis]MDP8321417.1 hypothetical protein [Candidatus Stygibacter australis]